MNKKTVYEFGDQFKCLKEQTFNGLVVCEINDTYWCTDFSISHGAIKITCEKPFYFFGHINMDEFHESFEYTGNRF